MDSALIDALVSPIVPRYGLEVDRIEVLPAGKRKVVRIFLDGDGPAGRGPSLDEIAEATKGISKRLDEAPELGNAPYTLEVSSRGVSRPLTEPKHFRRNAGRLVALTLAEGVLTGRIAGITDAGVVLETDEGAREFGFAAIRKAVVQVELNRATEPEAADGEDLEAADGEEE